MDTSQWNSSQLNCKTPKSQIAFARFLWVYGYEFTVRVEIFGGESWVSGRIAQTPRIQFILVFLLKYYFTKVVNWSIIKQLGFI